uniref:GPALPP motifs-containing protein 1 n=1 Tax=Oreochromis aureus TaxID=47969 RepID=A0A668TXB1_OREAU
MSCDKLIGPALPPTFRKEKSKQDTLVKTEPQSRFPAELQLKYRKCVDKQNTDICLLNRVSTEDDDGFFGPALPPGFKKRPSSPDVPPVLGPALPPGFHRAQYEDNDGEDADSCPGPALPPGYQAEPSSSEGEDEDVIGPMPANGPIQDTMAQDIERRAQRMKEKLTGDDAPEVLTRETWMTELPPELQHIGLGARTFKKRSGPEKADRSIWTDTPADRERKEEGLGNGRESFRTKISSLMNLHTKKMKEKAKEKADQPVERRPFDRDADLQVNRFDEAQKQRLLKKSQELNTRFSHSKERMFL